MSLCFLIFLLIPLAAAITTHCPNRCICVPDAIERERLHVSCKWDRIAVELRPFAHLAFNSTKMLNIECAHDNLLPSSFSVDTFLGFANLNELRIQNCRMLSLPEGLFDGLTELRSLYLHRLALPDQPLILSSRLFSGLNRLEKLSLIASHIPSIPRHSLCSLSKLQVLNVSSNWLSNVSLGVAEECQLDHLIIVDYSRNRIRNIHHNDLIAFPSLREISLAVNHLQSIAVGALRNNTLIQHLDLSSNLIEELPNLPDDLLSLNVADNRLSILPLAISTLKNLLTLNVSANAIDDSSPFAIASSELKTFDASSNQFATIPLSLISNCEQLENLILDDNRISQIPPMHLQNYTQLQRLSLASNRLTELKATSLDGIVQLTQLNLANNSIFQIEFGVFDQNVRLTDFDLSRNVLLEIPMAISKLTALKKLDLSHNQISKTYKFLFNKLQYLHRLDMSGNKLPTIASYVFSDMPRISSLDFSHNKIDNITADAFVKCPRLRHLNLAGNYISTFDGAIVSLGQLKRLNASDNIFTRFDWNEMPASLAELVMERNRIAEVGLAGSSSVKHIQLHGNFIAAISGAQLPNSVEMLNLSGNAIQTLAHGTFVDKQQIRVLDLRNNRLAILSENDFVANSTANEPQLYVAGNPLVCSCEMDWLKKGRSTAKSMFEVADSDIAECSYRIDRRRIKLSAVVREDLLCAYAQTCEPDCICCQFGHCDCKSACPPGCQCYHDAAFATNIVRCTGMNNSDRVNFSPKDLPMYATHVYLDRINMPIIRSHDFLGRIRLRQLYINASGVEEIQALAFNTLSSLQLLDLSGNRLRRLNGDELHKTHRLTHLSLNNNQITAIDDRVIAALPSLQFINLHGNQLKEVPTTIVKATQSLTSLSIADNPFRCDCSQRFSTQRWLAANHDKVIDASRVFCVENVTWAFRNNDTTVLSAYPPNNGDDIYQIPMLQFIELANRSICVPAPSGVFGIDATHNRILLATVFTSTLLILIGLLCIGISLIRRSHSAREQRRYTKAPPSLNNSTTPGCSPIPLLTYDVFVSYAKDDEHVVTEHLCRKLESEDYTLCLLYRDVPNNRCNDHVQVHRINNDMITKMDHSNSLIIVLTRNFIDHEWQTVQIRTAHQLFAKQIVKNKKVIVILGEQLELDKLDTELGHMLRKSTCIRWNETLFWTKLLQALPIRTSTISDSSQIYSDLYGSIVPSDIV